MAESMILEHFTRTTFLGFRSKVLPRSQTSQRFSPTARDFPATSSKALAARATHSGTFRSAFAGTSPCSGPGNAANLNAIPIFQGLQGQSVCAPSVFPQANANLGYLPNQQQFQALNFPQSVFLNQNYLNVASDNPTFLPLGF